MLRFWTKLIDLSNERLTKKIFLKDYNFYKKNWSYETKLIAEEINQLECFIQLEKFELKLAETALVSLQIETQHDTQQKYITI